MKFTDGYWEVKPNFSPWYAREYFAHAFDGGCLTVYASSTHHEHPGSLLNSPLFIVRLSAPRSGIVAVELTHFDGYVDPAPHYELFTEPVTPEFEETEAELIFRSGPLEARVDKRPNAWRISYHMNGTLLTQSDLKNFGYMTERGSGEGYLLEQLLISPGEQIYGLGERFTPLCKNGQVISMWNEDGGTASEIAYKNIPFYLSSRGYGVFVDSSAEVEFEVGSEKVTRVQFSLKAEKITYMVVGGPTQKQALVRYTGLTGKPALPPAWSFGLWLSACFQTENNEEVYRGFIDGMRERDIPLSVFHIDPYWMKPYEWVSLRFDEAVFPDAASFIARLKAGGLRLCLWINPYVGQKSPMFREGVEGGFFIRREDGQVWQTDRWMGGQAVVDFTNPDARAWYAGKLSQLIDMGVDTFKTDFGERIPVRGVRFFNGASPLKMHNYYTLLYNRTVFELLRDKKGEGEACVFARSTSVGGQQFPVHWGGDCMANYQSMAETLRGGLSFAVGGFGFWSHDISGFESTATPDLYKRWVAFGMLSSHSRLHGSMSYRVPWLFDDESSDVLRFFAKLKLSMMPYLYSEAAFTHATGIPMMRPMHLEFGDDPACRTLDMQYMMGGALLVAPIFNDRGEGEWYLPEGRWTHYLTGEAADGGWHRGQFDYFSLPLYQREDTIVARGNIDDQPDYDYLDRPELAIGCVKRGARFGCELVSVDGRTRARFSAVERDGRLHVTSNAVRAFSVRQGGRRYETNDGSITIEL